MTLTTDIKQAETNSFFLIYWDSQGLKGPQSTSFQKCIQFTSLHITYSDKQCL